MTHDECREALALYALGAVEAAERRALEAHVDGCRPCSAELAELRETTASLASLVTPGAPSAEHLERLLAALDAGDETPQRAAGVSTAIASDRRTARRRRRWRPLVIAMRLAVAAAVVLLAVSHVELRRRLDGAYLQIAGMRAIGSFVASPNVTVVPLWGAQAAGGAYAKLAYDRSTGRFVLLSSDLTPPPAGERYQLWVIAEGVHAAGALLPESPRGMLVAPPRSDQLFLFAVSLEPGEVEEPTGPMVLMSGPLRDPR